MVTLLRWAFWLCAAAVVVWFAATVPLGRRTLVQHLRAIASTPEAHSLAEGTREEAAKMADRVRQGLAPAADGASPSSPPAGESTGSAGGAGDTAAGGKAAAGDKVGRQPPSDQLDKGDRDALDRVVRERTGAPGPSAKRTPAR